MGYETAVEAGDGVKVWHEGPYLCMGLSPLNYIVIHKDNFHKLAAYYLKAYLNANSNNDSGKSKQADNVKVNPPKLVLEDLLGVSGVGNFQSSSLGLASLLDTGTLGSDELQPESPVDNGREELDPWERLQNSNLR